MTGEVPLALKYYAFDSGQLSLRSLRKFYPFITGKEKGPMIWSGRLSTGIFGLPTCPAGNKGPLGPSEVILAPGDEGLAYLIRSGFRACPTCHPEDVPGFWDDASKPIKEAYFLNEPMAFLSLPFDARQLPWEEILPIIKAVPNRLYIPPGLNEKDLLDLKRRFNSLGYPLPQPGWYNPEIQSDDQFIPYQMP